MAKAEGRATVLSEAALDEYTVVIVDVSRSGLQLELDTPVKTGVQIRVEFRGLTVVGKVANLRPHGIGRYRVGVLVNCVAQSRYEAAMTFGLQMLNERCGRPVELAPRAITTPSPMQKSGYTEATTGSRT